MLFYLRGFVSLFLTLPEFLIDFFLILRSSKASPFKISSAARINYDLIILAHTVEKGLSVKNIRYGFGKSKINNIFNLIDLSKNLKIDFLPAFSMVHDSFVQYLNLHSKVGYSLGGFGESIQNYIDFLSSLNGCPSSISGGAVDSDFRDHQNLNCSPIKNFLSNRGQAW